MDNSTNNQGALTQVGITLALAFNNADVQASTTKKELILNCVTSHNEAELKIVLDSYALEFAKFASASVVKVRKAEFNAVIQAVFKTEVSKDNVTALQGFKGGYNDFIELARTLRGKAERIANPKTSARPKELTEVQEKAVDESIKKASVNQLADIVDNASTEINRISAPNMAGMQQLILINSIANNMLKNKDLEKFVLAVAEELATTSDKAITQLREAMQATSNSINAVKNNVELPKTEVKQGKASKKAIA